MAFYNKDDEWILKNYSSTNLETYFIPISLI